MRLQLIVPCYNPDTGWAQTLAEKYHELLEAIPGIDTGLTLVNDGSTKGISPESLGYLQQAVPGLQWITYTGNMGKGYALRQGVQAASADYYLYTDIDFPYTIESMRAVYNDLLAGADVVVGVREAGYYHKVPLRRAFISKLLKKFIKYLLNINITDTQCGLKGFNNKGRDIFLRTRINRFLFDMEFVLYASHQKNLDIRPQTVYPRPGIVFSHMNYKVLMGESFNLVNLLLFHNKKS